MNMERYELERVGSLLDSGVLESDSLFAQSAFIEVLIRLHDLLQSLRARGQRISFTDDVEIKIDVNDITDLIAKLRNAACHTKSPNHNIESIAFVFNRITGNMPNAFKMGTVVLGCQYADDIASYYGEYRIYHNRHLRRLVQELSTIYGPTS